MTDAQSKPKPMKVLQWAQKPCLKRKRASKTSKRQLNQYVATKISTQASQCDVAEEETVRRARKVEAVAQRAIRLRAQAQALIEQADLATYRAVMAARIFDAMSNASASSQAVPNSKPDDDVMPSASFD